MCHLLYSTVVLLLYNSLRRCDKDIGGQVEVVVVTVLQTNYKKGKIAVSERIHMPDFVNSIQTADAPRKRAAQSVFTVAMEAKAL